MTHLMTRACLSERRCCDVRRKTENNGWLACSTDSRHRKTRYHGVFTCSDKTRGEKTRLAGRTGVRCGHQNTSFSTSPKGADCLRGKTFRETQSVFPQIPHVAGFFPAVYPCSTTDIGQDPLRPVVQHLMIGRQATGSMRCASSQHTLSPSEQGSSHSSGSSRLDRNGGLGPLGSSESTFVSV